jgi:tetratricopeptide (TPR) repeat protein
MLRSSLHFALVAALSTAGLSLPSPVHAAGPAAVDADQLYEEGRKDFSSGFYKSAIEKFEAAHRKSKDPLILYNIGQSYKKLYDEEPKVEFLKKARQALRDYVTAIEKDPGLGADPEEVKPVLEKIDAELARLEPAKEPEGPAEDPAPEAPAAVDPGKKLRLAGFGLMGGGGALLVVGGIVGGVFAAKGGKLSNELDTLYAEQTSNKCPATMLEGEPAACAGLRSDVESTRAAGLKSNTLAAVSLGVGGGLGALLLIGGIVSYSLGKKRSAAWKAASETARVRVAPTFGGLLITGRF